MPGYLPFAGALKLPAYTCDNCGFWQRHFAPPPHCPMCLDARHVVPQDGWRFRTAREAQEAFPCHWEELEPGVWRFWNEPVSGIGPSAYLIRTENGNMGFEGCPVFSEAALDQIERLGGMQVLSASHPHSYGALVQLQDRFDPELCLPAADFTWSAALQVSWPYDDFLEPLPGLELHRTAGHFDGHAVLFDRKRKICFCGDALKFELDPGDFVALAAGHRLGQIDAGDQGHQHAHADHLDHPKAANPAIEQARQAHEAASQIGAVVRMAARSFEDRARGLTANSASPGAMALLAIS